MTAGHTDRSGRKSGIRISVVRAVYAELIVRMKDRCLAASHLDEIVDRGR